jgi:hypothetical protein
MLTCLNPSRVPPLKSDSQLIQARSRLYFSGKSSEENGDEAHLD